MAPAGQYVFAEMWSKSEQCTAGSHEWLPYSRIWAFMNILKGYHNCQPPIRRSRAPPLYRSGTARGPALTGGGGCGIIWEKAGSVPGLKGA